MVETLADLVASRKAIAAPTSWAKAGRRFTLKLPLEIEGIIEEDLFLRGTALEEFPDEAVTFQLEYHGVAIPGGTGPLLRFEWLPLRPHNNKGVGPRDLRFLEIAGSHVHLFDDNWDEVSGAMRPGNLPVARPCPDWIGSFADCVDYLGDLFVIVNPHVIPVPEWSTQFNLGMKR